MSYKDKSNQENETISNVTKGNSNDCQTTAKNPMLFAEWINEWIVLRDSFENDMELSPNEEDCKRLNISDEERRMHANEFVLLRAWGAIIFVRNNLEEKYYLTFREAIMIPVIERMNKNSPYLHHDDPMKALNEYLEVLKSKELSEFSRLFYKRVWPNCPMGFHLYNPKISLYYFEYIMKMFEFTRDGYCKLLTGLKYDQFEGLLRLSELEC